MLVGASYYPGKYAVAGLGHPPPSADSYPLSQGSWGGQPRRIIVYTAAMIVSVLPPPPLIYLRALCPSSGMGGPTTAKGAANQEYTCLW